jgi:hypothetical protein
MMRTRRRNARKIVKLARALAVLGDPAQPAVKPRRRSSISLSG